MTLWPALTLITLGFLLHDIPTAVWHWWLERPDRDQHAGRQATRDSYFDPCGPDCSNRPGSLAGLWIWRRIYDLGDAASRIRIGWSRFRITAALVWSAGRSGLALTRLGRIRRS